MNIGSISISTVRSDLRLDKDFPESADSLFTRTNEEGGRKIKSTIEVSDEGEFYLLDFQKVEYEENKRVMEIVAFSATYVPGEDLMKVEADSDDHADDLYQIFKDDD